MVALASYSGPGGRRSAMPVGVEGFSPVASKPPLLPPRCPPMTKQPTIAELARDLIRLVYEATDGGMRRTRVLTKSPSAKAALEFAVDNDWVVVEGEQDVSLTASGLAVVKKGLS
jgi:hypothetical protein